MSIYRGAGGTGDGTSAATINIVTEQTLLAIAAASEAEASAESSALSAAAAEASEESSALSAAAAEASAQSITGLVGGEGIDINEQIISIDSTVVTLDKEQILENKHIDAGNF